MIAPAEILAQVSRLPAFPTSAARLGELLHDERAGAPEVEKVIRPDPALTANLLRMASSAYFSPRSRPETVRQAVTLLGVKRTFEIATGAALCSLIPAAPSRLRPRRARLLAPLRGGGGVLRAAGPRGRQSLPGPPLHRRPAPRRRQARHLDLRLPAGQRHPAQGPKRRRLRGRGARGAGGGPRRDRRPGGGRLEAAGHGGLGGPVAPPAGAGPAEVDRTLVSLVHLATRSPSRSGSAATRASWRGTVDPGVAARRGHQRSPSRHVASDGLEAIHELAAAFGDGWGEEPMSYGSWSSTIPRWSEPW